MNTRSTILPLLFLLVGSLAEQALADDFFRIDNIRFLQEEPKDKQGVYSFKPHPSHRHLQVRDEFIPCLAVTVSAKQKIHPDQLQAKVYYYDAQYRKIASTYAPSEIERPHTTRHYAWPRLISPEKETLYFAVPTKVLKQKNWEALVVFGDRKGMTAKQHPGQLMQSRLDYAEKKLVNSKKKVKRKAFETPIIEHVVKTRHHQHKQITFIIRPPAGAKKLEEAEGVFAVCLLANNVEDLKRTFMGDIEPGGRLGRYADLCDEHNMAMVCWGAQKMWLTGKSWDELDKYENYRVEQAQVAVMDAWGKGIEEMHKKYGLPNEHFLLTGYSAAAHFTLRLAMRQPHYFLAVHAHIPNSFDKPTPEASQSLWLLTTGELDRGYERSLKFYQRCRAMGYPMIYKSIMRLGHQNHPIADALAYEFFDYALTKKKERIEYLNELKNPLSDLRQERLDHPNRPWLKDFQAPKFIGDKVNQEMFLAKEIDLVPKPFRVPLPTQELANAWDKNP